MIIRGGTQEARDLKRALKRLGRRLSQLETTSDEGTQCWLIADDDPAIALIAEMKERRAREAMEWERKQENWAGPYAAEIRKLFPGCPERIAMAIGLEKGYRSVDPESIAKVVEAYVRHNLTNYELLFETYRMRRRGYRSKDGDRDRAREAVAPKVNEILSRWRLSSPD